MTWRPPFHRRRPPETDGEAELVDRRERRRGHIAIGDLVQRADARRDGRGVRWLDDITQDIRHAARGLLKDRGFTAVAVAALAFGIGIYNLQFSIVNAICIRGLPIERADRVMFVSSRDAQNRDGGISARDFQDLRAGAGAFAGLAALSVGPVAVGDEGRAPERAVGAFVSFNALALIGEAPRAGRDFREEDDVTGAPAVTILADSFWKSRYAGDPDVLGRTVRVNGVPATVIGVMPDGFKFPNNADLWQPLSQLTGLATQPRDQRGLGVFGRLRDGTTRPQAEAELHAAAAELARTYPETNRGITSWLVPINERYNGRLSDPVWQAFLIAGILVAVIACANVANLLLARLTRRAREMAIRASLGATRFRLVRQLLVESLLIAGAGGIGGLAVSAIGLRLFAQAIPDNGLPYFVRLTMDTRVFATLVLMSVGTVLVFGVAPALQVSRTDVQSILKDGGAHSGTQRARRWTTGFLTAELALTMVSLSAVAAGFWNFRAAQRADVVIDPKPLLSMWVTLPTGRYPSAAARMALMDQLSERLRAHAGLTAWTWASALPFSGATARPVTVEGHPVTLGAPAPTASVVAVGPRYFETLGVPLDQGREFNIDDGAPGTQPVIVNRRFVRDRLGSVDPIGQHIGVPIETGAKAVATDFTVVGVSPDIRQRGRLEAEPVIYVAARLTAPATAALIVRSKAAAEAATSEIREEIRALDSDLPLYRVQTMERALWEAGFAGRISNRLASTITLIALLLALVGLYAVTAHSVTQRHREFGIRAALGASSGRTVRLVLRQTMVYLALGIVVGFACTWLWERALGDPTAPNRATDPTTFVPIAVLLVAVATLACLVPAYRATRADPVLALRTD